tara:strand:+ start:1329 stop:1793 length:465 start_codon:yes stop_codon:yes gene_type:complete
MAEEIKCVINDSKNGKSYSKPVDKSTLSGRKIGEKVPGNLFGLTGYELTIKGGSDNAGFPMRPEIDTHHRKRIFVQNSVGVKIKERGQFKRKTIRGNTISNETAQVNLIVSKYGTKPVQELITPTEEKPKEEKEKKPEVEKKEEPKSQEAEKKE